MISTFCVATERHSLVRRVLRPSGRECGTGGGGWESYPASRLVNQVERYRHRGKDGGHWVPCGRCQRRTRRPKDDAPRVIVISVHASSRTAAIAAARDLGFRCDEPGAAAPGFAMRQAGAEARSESIMACRSGLPISFGDQSRPSAPRSTPST